MMIPFIFSGAARIISLLLLAGLLQACSAAKLAYNQAPQLAYLYLDGYVDFSGEQSVQVKAELNKLQSWHRQTQLPATLELLQKLQQKIPLDVTVQEACDTASDIRRSFFVLSDQTQPALLSLLSTITSRQIDQMARKFEKSNADFRDDYLQSSQSVLQSKRYKQTVSRAEMLYGRLAEQQTTLIASQLEKSRFNAAIAYAERQRRQQDILQTLRALIKNQSTPEQKKIAVNNLFDRVTSPHATHVDHAAALAKETCANYASLHNSTTSSQRRKAQDKLTGFEQDLKTLIEQSNNG